MQRNRKISNFAFSKFKNQRKNYLMNTDWFLIPIIINLALLAYVKYNYANYIMQILVSTFEYNTSVAIFRENKNNKPSSAHLLFLIFIISSVIFSVQLFQQFSPDILRENFWFVSVISFVIIIALIFLSKLSNFILGKIFKQEDIGREYNHNIDIFNQSFGLILLPVTILTAFTNISNLFVYLGIIMFGITYLLRVIRLIKINFNKHLNILYIFLYLCTLEIIPILYLVKIITIL